MTEPAFEDLAAPGQSRRYDLDWLRVLAFGLLILYHVGMYYVTDWDWHIKSPQTSDFLQNVMLLVNPWRMSLLFFVSGAALFFACRKISRLNLVRLRNRRLLLPLLFGMAVIVPPQLYVELVAKEGMANSYLQFYVTYLNPETSAFPAYRHEPLGLWTWNHLWFLAYLWIYTLVFVVVKPMLDRLVRQLRQASVGAAALLLAPVLLLTAWRLALAEAYPPNNALFGDWYNHARYLSLLLGGYLLVSCDWFWRITRRHAWSWLGAALVSYASLLMIVHTGVETVTALLGESAGTVLIRLTASLNQWLWILAVLGLGVRYLNRPSPVLEYMNVAILPWYILHQTLIVLFAFWLAPLRLWQPLEVMLLLVGTVGGCAAGYELLRRVPVGRLLFGLKPTAQQVAGRAQSLASAR